MFRREPPEAALEGENVEVHQQTHRQARQAQVSHRLCFVKQVTACAS